MDKILKQPVLSLLSMSIGAATGFYSVSVTATEINTAFMQGTTDVPSVLKDGVKYPAG
ncbi:hypothetical protein JGB64_24355, partial [Salmonella enterica subsp. enterica serovar Typhimurium]|nr:hypothetical protein [Salmonella enterica subsp. enterica serovar Typhimurium]